MFGVIAPPLNASVRRHTPIGGFVGILSAVLLYILVSIFAPGVEKKARFKILGTAIAASIAQNTLVKLVPNLLGFAGSIVLSVGIVVTLLTLWCEVERKVALKIASIYMGSLLALAIVASLFLHAA